MVKTPKIAKAQGRSVAEWVGKNANSVPPPTVLLRIWDRHNGICHISGLPIGKKPWDADHIKALEDGGLNVESNLAPALRSEHKKKTAQENKARAEADRKRVADIGAKAPSKRSIQSRGFNDNAPRANDNKPAPKVAPGSPNLSRRFK